MKKLHLLFLGLVASSLVQAQSVSISRHDYQGVKGSGDATFTSVSYRDKINDNWFGDVVFLQVQQEATQSVSTRLETGLTYNHKLSDNLSGYVRTAIGQRHRASGTGNHLFYSVEPGFNYRVDKVVMGVGYRYRNGFDPADLDKTETYRFRVGYDITKKDMITIQRDITRGDSDVNTIGATYTRRF